MKRGRNSEMGARTETCGPWERQGLHRRGLAVGVGPVRVTEWTERRKLGGWSDAEYREAYKAHWVPYNAQSIARYLGPEEALRELTRLRACATAQWRGGPGVPQKGVPEADLGFDHSRVTPKWGSGSGTWLPPGGCWRSGAWPEDMKEALLGIGLNMRRVEPLPLFMGSRAVTGEAEKEVLTQTVRDYLDAGFIRRWDFGRGFPTVVIPLHVIKQGSKYRIISDMRYSNGATELTEMIVPSVTQIGLEVLPGDKFLKLDLKAGYPQMHLLQEEAGRFATFVFEDVLYEFMAAPFGARHLPGRFQTHTAFVAGVLRARFNIRVYVYVDDFLCVVRKDQTPPSLATLMEVLCSFGMVFGLKKCSKEWTSEVEMLGIMISAGETGSRLYMSEEKSGKLTAEITSILAMEWTDTLVLAQLLGRLTAAEPAVKHVALAARAGFHDLAKALGKETLEFFIRASDTSQYAWDIRPLQLSPRCRMSLQKLLNNWESWNGKPGGEKLETIDLLVASDASEYQVGCDAKLVDPITKTEHRLDVAPSPLPDYLVGESSLVREAWGVSTSIRSINIKGKRIGLYVDNKGLASRFHKGVACEETTEILFLLLIHVLDQGAEVVFIRWIPRELNTFADKKSKEGLGGEGKLKVTKAMFTSLKLEPQPNLDGFADHEDHILDRYCSAEREDKDSLGNFFEYKLRWDDVVWLHPSLPMIRRTIKHWLGSESQLLYVLVPRIAEARWYSMLDVLGAKLERGTNQVSVERDGAKIGAHWKFEVYSIRK